MVNKKITVLFALIIFSLSAFASYSYFSDGEGGINSPVSNYQAPKNGNSIAIDPSEPKTEECPLNGEMLTKTHKDRWVTRRPLGVMVENHVDARPQSGLSSADIVYEAVAEGGITRFLSIFYCKDAQFVGPVRSARIYFIRMLQGYGAFPLYAHVGGANTDGPADALGEINDLGWGNYNDLNQFSVPFPVFYRDYERLPDRATEHTVYTATTKLWDYAKTKRELTNVDNKGVSWDTDFKTWKFQDEATAENRGSTTKVSFGFWDASASDFSVDWAYDKASNTYVRSNGGSPHNDKNTNKPITAKNIVVYFAKESVANDGYEHGQHILYGVIGTGKGVLFQNGKRTNITWSKKTEDSREIYTDEAGKEVQFVRGPIWIEILPTGNKVTS